MPGSSIGLLLEPTGAARHVSIGKELAEALEPVEDAGR